MIQYKCDRCKRIIQIYEKMFTVKITPPTIELHFCIDCMDKINECIDELGSAKIEG